MAAVRANNDLNAGQSIEGSARGKHILRNNSGPFFSETKSTPYGVLLKKPLLMKLDAVGS